MNKTVVLWDTSVIWQARLQAVWVRALAGVIALCSLSRQVHKQLVTNLMLGVALLWNIASFHEKHSKSLHAIRPFPRRKKYVHQNKHKYDTSNMTLDRSWQITHQCHWLHTGFSDRISILVYTKPKLCLDAVFPLPYLVLACVDVWSHTFPRASREYASLAVEGCFKIRSNFFWPGPHSCLAKWRLPIRDQASGWSCLM